MAVTAHFCTRDTDGRLVLRSHLIAFRLVKGSHTGVHLAKILMEVIKSAGIEGRVSVSLKLQRII